MKRLTTEQCINLENGLLSLDGFNRVVKDGAVEKVVVEFYKLSAMLRLAIGMNIDELRKVTGPHEKMRKALVLEMQGGKDKIPDAKIADFNTQMETTLRAKHRVKLVKIKHEELALDKNDIPGSTLSLLQLILVQPEIAASTVVEYDADADEEVG